MQSTKSVLARGKNNFLVVHVPFTKHFSAIGRFFQFDINTAESKQRNKKGFCHFGKVVVCILHKPFKRQNESLKKSEVGPPKKNLEVIFVFVHKKWNWQCIHKLTHIP